MTDDLHQSPQLALWRGEFGQAYMERNRPTEEAVSTLTRMWARMLQNMRPAPTSIVEVGCNVGLNLRALRRVTAAELLAVEPNASARAIVVRDGIAPAEAIRDGVGQSLPFADASADLVFTSGVLIHVDPDALAACCTEVHRVSRRYILCSEYFSTTPRMVNYRGKEGQLFTRDFGAFYLEHFPDLRLVDYGFFWTGAGAVDDLTWWLFEKVG